MLSESWFGDKTVTNQFVSCFTEASISNVRLPYVENLGNSVAFKKLNVRDYIEECRFMHPV